MQEWTRAHRTALLAAVLLTPVISAPARAGTIAVTTTLDQRDGAAPCSLREAVDTANADSNSGGCVDARPATADTIKLAGGDYNLQRTVSGGSENLNAGGDLDVTGDLTIAGAGADLTGIDGNGAITFDPVIELMAAGNLTISGLTVHDGRGDAGGGIRSISGAPVKLIDSTVRDNTVELDGGAICVFGGPVTLIRSTVTNNTAQRVGGGIYAQTVTLTDSTVTGNGAVRLFQGDPGGFGGGIHADGTVKLTNSTVSGNEAEGGGGGGIETFQAAKLTNSTVSGNEANGPGGGVLAATAELTNSTVRDNRTPGSGGGVSAGAATLTNSTVRDNRTFGSGGGVSAGAATLTNSTVSANQASGGGGGIGVTSTAVLTKSSVSGNTAGAGGGGISGAGSLTDSTVSRNASGAEGGGVYAVAGSLTVNRSTVSDNDATNNAGGIFYSAPGALAITSSTLSGNESNGWGGALSTDEGTTTIRNATINRNVADANAEALGIAGDGGGLDQFGDATVTLSNTILAGNFDRSSSAFEFPDWNCNGGSVVSEGYNLVSSTAGCAVAPATGDQTAADPGLADLANNGGRMLTQQLLASSPAVNAGSPAGSGFAACPSTDQRGVPRSLGGRCDIGAYQRASCHGNLVNLVGTGNADVILGTSSADGIVGLGGADVLRGGGAADGLCGLGGNDQLLGESGADFLDGGADTDTCNGGNGTDQAIDCETLVSVP